MSQPAREFIVKIVELSLWSGDLLLGHFLLYMLTPPILIPYFDRFHSTILCELSYESFKVLLLTHVTILVWLRPSNQIRAPLYSPKQKRQRRWIVSRRLILIRGGNASNLFYRIQVIEYGLIYIAVIALFVALIAIRKFIEHSDMILAQAYS